MGAIMPLTGCATLATALFTGAAVYITLVEHPARLRCTTEAAIAQWRPSYKRATAMQASLASLGTLSCIAAWLAGAGLAWLLAGLLLGAVILFTLLVIAPTNLRLEDRNLDPTSELARHLLSRWGRLHAVRSGLSLIALLLMMFARG
jgi:Domain of unknown function (DUF1772)